MKAPVATNKLNFALAMKNTSNGPSSVASLNKGCGWVLSILALNSRNGLGEIASGERREVIDAFADADEVHRQFELFRQRHQNAAARGAVEFGHHQAGNASGTLKRLDLR